MVSLLFSAIHQLHPHVGPPWGILWSDSEPWHVEDVTQAVIGGPPCRGLSITSARSHVGTPSDSSHAVRIPSELNTGKLVRKDLWVKGLMDKAALGDQSITTNNWVDEHPNTSPILVIALWKQKGWVRTDPQLDSVWMFSCEGFGSARSWYQLGLAQVLVMTSRLTHRAVFEHFEAGGARSMVGRNGKPVTFFCSSSIYSLGRSIFDIDI